VEETDQITKNMDIWIWDLSRTIRTRLTFSSGPDAYPSWSPDGSKIYYSSTVGSDDQIMVKSATGVDSARVVLGLPKNQWIMDVSLDGRLLAYIEPGATGAGDDLWMLPLGPDGMKAGDPYPFQTTQFDDDDARFSPDGRWVAYGCDETGDFEVYVRPVSGQGGKWQVSSNGGDLPTWRRDGRELYYISPNDELMAVEVHGDGDSFEVGQPRKLFTTGSLPVATNKPYDVSPDGQRFLIEIVERGAAAGQVNLVVNWNAELAGK
jgi:Tol biopolymer transport system component